MPAAPVCGPFLRPPSRFSQLRGLAECVTLPLSALQDDTYTESYISTIGVDFVSRPLPLCSSLYLCFKMFPC